MVGGTWEPPLYQTIRKLPFIPKETEIDQLIAGCSQRMATFLQMLKETGARCGEIWRLKWDDIDFESKVVNITRREKQQPTSHTPKQQTLRNAQTTTQRTTATEYFHTPNMPVDNHCGNLLSHQRKRLAHKLSNPRLLKIHFHTFRYWKGTMLYHETKDMLLRNASA